MRADRGLRAVVAATGTVLLAVIPPAVAGNRLAVRLAGYLSGWPLRPSSPPPSSSRRTPNARCQDRVAPMRGVTNRVSHPKA
ncbi:hypothetical protein CcI49_04060 [Frankia sp. CcI49]|nr:hypothetical protein CcI49_04060 [Frankia sp. CcI49]